jgi:hypothetical protein
VRALLVVVAAAAFPSAIPIRTDGERYAAWEPQPGSLFVRDERMGRTRAFRIAPECYMVDARHGIFLMSCRDVPRLVLPRRSTLQSVPGHTLPSAEYYAAVGRRWLKGYGHNRAVFYTDWRTGISRAFGDDDRERDLDSRDLRLVKPPRRPTCQQGAGFITCMKVSPIRPLTVVTAYDSRTGKRLRRWRPRTVLDSVQHTARSVYFNIRAAGGGYDVHRVRWRR